MLSTLLLDGRLPPFVAGLEGAAVDTLVEEVPKRLARQGTGGA